MWQGRAKKICGLSLMILGAIVVTGCDTSLSSPSPVVIQVTAVGQQVTASSAPVTSTTFATNTTAPNSAPSIATVAPTSAPTTSAPTPTTFGTTATVEVAAATAVSPTFTPIIAPTPTIFSGNATLGVTVSTTTANITSSTITITEVAADAEQQKFVVLINNYRQSNGVGALTPDPYLYQSALWLAKDMAANNTINHTDSQGRDIATCIHAFGFTSPIVGENIAGGMEKAVDVLNIWESDQVHKDNLLGKYYTRIGIARYYQANTLNRWYWVLDMGGK